MELVAVRDGVELYELPTGKALIVDHNNLEASIISSVGIVLKQGYWRTPNNEGNGLILSEKHLAGQHNQQRHAGGKGGGDAPVSARVRANQLREQHRAAQQAVYARMREARTTNDYSGISALRRRASELQREYLQADREAERVAAAAGAAPRQQEAKPLTEDEEQRLREGMEEDAPEEDFNEPGMPPAGKPIKGPEGDWDGVTYDDESEGEGELSFDDVRLDLGIDKLPPVVVPEPTKRTVTQEQIDTYDPADIFKNDSFLAAYDHSSSEIDPESAVRNIFGERKSAEDIGRLVGAPDGADVIITADYHDDYGAAILVSTTHPSYRGFQYRTMYRGADGKPRISNDLFELHDDAPKGMGTSIFNRQVREARRQGVSGIDTQAARGTHMNGYYTWPRLGYDAEIPLQAKRYLSQEDDSHPVRASNPRRVSDLMRSPEGREWWKQWGETTYMSFDLGDSSLSMYVLNEYISGKLSG